MFKSEFDQIIRENFNLSDNNTRRYIVALEDAGKDQLLAALSSALYDKIVSKVDDIDFGTIPLSRGDITKVEGFAGTEECLNIIRRLVLEYKQDTAVVDVVLTAIQNIKDRKPIFTKAYALNVELPMVIYNVMVLSIERSTSLMIATCMEYVKDPASESPKAALDKVAYQKTMDDMLFRQLIAFNNMCKSGSLDKTLEACMKHPIKEDAEIEFDVVAPAEPDVNINADDAIEDLPVESPFAPNNDTEPFSEPEEAPVAPPATEEEPEEAPAPCDGPECEDAVSEELPEEPTPDELPPVDPAEMEVPEDEANANVEPENIPTVVPGDDVTDSDKAISEEETDDEMLPVDPGVEEPVEEAKTPVKKSNFVLSGLSGLGLAAVVVAATPIVLIKVIIPFLRVLVYTFYNTKMKLSDYLEIQAELIEANATDLQYSSDSSLSDDEKKKVVKKQLKWAKRLREWSNKFAIDSKSTANKTKKDIEADSKDKKLINKNDNGDDALF